MRVQLQLGRKDLDSRYMYAVDARKGVTVNQVEAAIRELRDGPFIPRSQRRRASAAYEAAVRWLRKVPPNGIAVYEHRHVYFDKTDTNGYRFDIVNEKGHNLKYFS